MSLSPSQRKLQRPHSSNVTARAPREAASSDLAAQLRLTLGRGAELYNQVIAKQLCNKRTTFYWKDLAKSQQWARWELEQSASSTILRHASHDSTFFTHNLCNQFLPLSFIWLLMSLSAPVTPAALKQIRPNTDYLRLCQSWGPDFVFWLCSVTQTFCSILLPPVCKRRRKKVSS